MLIKSALFDRDTLYSGGKRNEDQDDSEEVWGLPDTVGENLVITVCNIVFSFLQALFATVESHQLVLNNNNEQHHVSCW